MVIIDSNYKGPVSRDINDYPEGLVIVADKPYRWTSADVIRKVKYSAIRHFGKKNLKVGHAGTLDPLADGVLLICIGNACKQAQALQATDKEYVAGVCFGATTPSYDMEKDFDRHCPVDGVSRENIEAVLPSFLGEQDQVAPLFSAKMVDGVRAYDLARKMLREGGALDDAASELLQVNHITINSIELLDFSTTNASTIDRGSGASSRINVIDLPEGMPLAHIRIACTKGTYVRALARDLGERLDSGAFLSSLSRTRSGTFCKDSALDVDSIVDFLA